jgi:hypothetical protein
VIGPIATLVEVIPGKVSGAPLLKNDCYPDAGVDAIRAIPEYRDAHQFQAQP